jgi:hypothetical protein
VIGGILHAQESPPFCGNSCWSPPPSSCSAGRPRSPPHLRRPTAATVRAGPVSAPDRSTSDRRAVSRRRLRGGALARQPKQPAGEPSRELAVDAHADAIHQPALLVFGMPLLLAAANPGQRDQPQARQSSGSTPWRRTAGMAIGERWPCCPRRCSLRPPASAIQPTQSPGQARTAKLQVPGSRRSVVMSG